MIKGTDKSAFNYLLDLYLFLIKKHKCKVIPFAIDIFFGIYVETIISRSFEYIYSNCLH